MADNKTNINWFPGHMSKALKEMKEKTKLVDLIIELNDARAPISSSNPLIKEIIGNKSYLKVLNKSDLVDEETLSKFKNYYQQKNIKTITISATNKNHVSLINEAISEVAKPLIEKDLKRGLKPRLVRVMILGIPNVGKSTLINTLANRKSASVANKPGHTKSQQWVKCNNYELLDTPGVLWPNMHEFDVGTKLALIGCIKEEILPTMDLCEYAFNYLQKYYPNVLYNKYGVIDDNFYQFLEKLAFARKHLLKNNEYDIERTAKLILNDFKNGNIGKICVDREA